MFADRDRLCEEQHEMAVEMDSRYVHALDASDYAFGRFVGLEVLSLIRSDFTTPFPTVLDIGAGYGTFLREAIERTRFPIRAVGFNAVSNSATDRLNQIDWVFGDFQRQQTWTPEDTLEDQSVELAVANYTFMHFADPVRALNNAISVLNIGGNLFIDRLNLRLSKTDSQAMAREILSQLESSDDSYSYDAWEPEPADGLYELALHRFHFQKNKDDSAFPSLTIVDESRRRAEYGLV